MNVTRKSPAGEDITVVTEIWIVPKKPDDVGVAPREGSSEASAYLSMRRQKIDEESPAGMARARSEEIEAAGGFGFRDPLHPERDPLHPSLTQPMRGRDEGLFDPANRPPGSELTGEASQKLVDMVLAMPADYVRGATAAKLGDRINAQEWAEAIAGGRDSVENFLANHPDIAPAIMTVIATVGELVVDPWNLAGTGVTRKAVSGARAARDRAAAALKKREESAGEVAPPVSFKDANPEEFLEARNSSPRKQYLTTMLPGDVNNVLLEGGHVKMSPDGKAGYLVTKDGDLQSVFNNSDVKGLGALAIKDALRNGAKKLDAFSGFLSDYYKRFGFKTYEVVKFDEKLAPPNWNLERDGRPDVHFMRLEEKVGENTPGAFSADKNAKGHSYVPAEEMTGRDLADAMIYDRAPVLDHSAVPKWDALRAETDRLFPTVAKKYRLEKVTGQPYKTAEEMFKDMENGVLKVTTDNSDHPLFGLEDNWKFRAVHDAIHFEVGADFSLAGERKAFEAHAKKLKVPGAVDALEVEVFLQAAAAVAHGGEFQVQKVFDIALERAKHAPAEGASEHRTLMESLSGFTSAASDIISREAVLTNPDAPLSVALRNNLAAVGAGVFAEHHGTTKITFQQFREQLLSQLPDGIADRILPKDMKAVYEKAKVKYREILEKADKHLPSTDELTRLYQRGEFLKHWYDDARKEIERLFGPDAPIFMRFLAATSPRTSVAGGKNSNIERAMNAYLDWKLGNPFTDQFNKSNLERAAAGLPFGDDSPKVSSFFANLWGDLNAVTNDGWMAKIFGFDPNAGLTPSQYQYMTAVVRREADKLGIAPREYQAALWVGAKLEAGLRAGEAVETMGASLKRLIEKSEAEGTLDLPFKEGLGEAGKASYMTTMLVARIVAGAVVGPLLGDEEDRLRNAFIGAGLGAAMTPELLKKVTDLVVEQKSALTKPARTEGQKAAIAAAQEASKERSWTPSQFRALYNKELEDYHVAGHHTRHDNEVKAGGYLMVELGHISPGSIRRMMPGTTMNDAEIYAMSRVIAKSGERVMTLARQIDPKNPDKEALDEFLKQLYYHGLELDPKRRAVRSETGRSMRIFDSEDPDVAGLNRFLDQFSGLMGKLKFGQSPERIAQLASSLKSQDELAVFAKGMVQPGLWDMFTEMWINGLLSGPKTHIVNIASNLTVIPIGIAERALSRVFGSSTAPGEAAAMVRGTIEGFVDALAAAKKAWLDDAPQFGAAKMEERRRAISSETLNLTGVPGRAVDWIGTAIRVPGRALLASDEFFKAIAYRAELRAQALRDAYEEVSVLGLTGKEAASKINEMVEHGLANPSEDIKRAAEEYATYATFTRDLGETGQKIQAVASTPLGRLAMPFVRTPINIFKFAGERTPMALVTKGFWEEIQAGGARGELALAKLSFGSMVMLTAGAYAAEGKITGGGPKDPVLREQWLLTHQPYSIKVGDKWYQYNRLEPAGSLVGMAADAADIIGQHDDGEGDDEIAVALAVAAAKNATSKTYVKGLAEILMAVSDPERYAEQAIKHQVSTALPFSSAVKAVAQFSDPVLRDARTIVDSFLSKTPGFSETVKPKYNLFGEPILRPGGASWGSMSPVATSSVTHDAVADEVVKNQVAITPINRSLHGAKMTEEQYEFVQVQAGRGIRINGRTLHDGLEHLMASGIYRSGTEGPDGRRALLIKEMVDMYRQRAELLALKEYPDLKYDIKELRRLKTQMMKSVPFWRNPDMPDDRQIDRASQSVNIDVQ